MILRILDIKVERGLPQKFKMPELPKFDGTRDSRTHLSSYLIAIKTTHLNKGKWPNSLLFHLRNLCLHGTIV